jgi:peptidoglycan/LPS O-acetylase OafA/YrhL
MTYRADIDGLRAIAIILVLIYHAGCSWVPSGFIGVDVFFVISGFLITTIVHNSLTQSRFSFIEFFNRRIWRLQPVLICCLFVTLALTLLFFLPDDLIQYSKSARKTTLFFSNEYFRRTTTGYFSPDVHQLPLLHTWSLSIEWQCYLVLPFMMYGLHRLFKQHLIIIVGLLTMLGFFLCLHYSQITPAQTYYQFSSRFFEFLIGSCTALIPIRKRKINQYILNCAAFLALFSILYIASLDRLLLGYPNGYALLVCLATAFLIVLGTFYPEQVSTKFLSTRPMVFIGLLSYSLYIWHWPVFVFLNYYPLQETRFASLVGYGFIFILAYVSRNYIEKPTTRFKTLKFHYTIVSLIFVPLVLIHIIAHGITRYEGIPSRFNSELVTIYQQLNQYFSPQRAQCMSGDQSKINLTCTLGAKAIHSKTALMIGDSFSNHYWGFMDMLGKNADISILAQGTSACLTLPGIYLYDWWNYKSQLYQICYDQTQEYYRLIRNNHYDYVIIGQIWSNYISDNILNKLGEKRSLALTKKRIAKALDKALALITHSGAKPVIMNTSALMEKSFHDCFYRHIKLRQTYEPGQCNFKLVSSDSDQWFNRLFAQMKIKYPQLIIIDPKEIQCKKGICVADIEGIPVYRDVGHITDYASYKFGEYYLKKFPNPLVARMKA